MAGQKRRVEQRLIPQRDVVRPELIPGAFAKPAKPRDQLGRARDGSLGRIGEHPNEPVLGHRTGGPSPRAVVGEPVVGRLVMDMVGIKERDEQIDVEERRLLTAG